MTRSEEMDRTVERLADAARDLLDHVRDLEPDGDDEASAWREMHYDVREPVLCTTLERRLRDYERLRLEQLAGGAV